MLLHNKIDLLAHQLMEVRTSARILPVLADRETLSMDDALLVARRMMGFRTALGETPVGWRIGFNVPRAALPFEVDRREPIWAPVYDTTIRYSPDNTGTQSLTGAVQPCITPHIVFQLGETPPVGASVDELMECVAWIAHGLEILSCPFANWQFTIADAIAASGLHGTLIVGEPHALTFAMQQRLTSLLQQASLSLSGTKNHHGLMTGAGFCNDVLDDPAQAMWYLHSLLCNQSLFTHLQAGDIVCVAVWTEAYPVTGGQTWTTQFTGIGLPGLRVHLTD